MSIRATIWSGLLCGVLAFAGSSLADRWPQTQADALKTITQKIKNTQQHIITNKKHRIRYQHELQHIEKRLSTTQQRLRNTQRQLQQQHRLLRRNQATATRYQQQLVAQRKKIIQLTQAIYVFGQQPHLKLLLNQNDHDKTRRFLYYYHLINRQQLNALKALHHIIDKIKQQQQQIDEVTQRLYQLKENAVAKQQDLIKLKQKRQKIIIHLNQQISSQHQKLAVLVKNQQALSKTLDKLNRKARFISQHFIALKGHLIWPVHGKIITGYHREIGNSQLHTDGIVVQAPANTAVKAVANGRVVFANWLNGYGLLIIISHGRGYMTLYGRNSVLYYHVGDWVTRHTTIAMVGDTGGHQQPALYFAIRHNAKPIDPLPWLTHRVSP